MRRSFFLFPIVIACISCKHSDPKPVLPSTFLRITTSPNNFGGTESWIFATDKDGKVLDLQQNVAGKVSLQSTELIPDSINLTLFYFTHPAGSSEQCIFETFGGLPKNSVIEPGSGPFTTPPATLGSASITVQDYNDQANFFLSPSFSNGIDQFSGTANDATNEFNVSLTVKENHANILASGFNKGVPVYTWFNGVKPNDALTKSFSEFTPYPKTIPLDFEGEVIGILRGFNNNEVGTGYMLGNLMVVRNQDQGFVPTLGYLDGFDAYSTFVGSFTHDANSHGRSSMYTKNGTINTSITLPSYDFTATDQSIQHFGFTFNGAYDHKIITWSYGDSNTGQVTWIVHSGNVASPKMTQIPETLVSKYPVLDLSKFNYYNTQLFKFLDGYSYQNFLSDNFFETHNRSDEYFEFIYDN